MTESTPPLLCVQDVVATLTLNRPAQANRLQNEDLAALMAHFARVDQDPTVRVLVLRANTAGQARPVFCAGYDIGGFDEPGGGSGAFEAMADAYASLRPVTICALDGSIHGGATDLFISSDLRLALEGVALRMPATALGLHYYPSGLQRYIERMGMAFTKRAFLTARPFTARQLWDAGCLEALTRPEEFEQALAALVRDVAALAPLALRTTKQSIDELVQGRIDTPALRERERLTLQSEDFAEGRRAFEERRLPRFRGR